MGAIYKRELRSYFNGVIGLLFAAFILLVAGIYTARYNFSLLVPGFEYALSATAFMFLPAIPVLTMRSIAEEKHSKTDQLIYSLPLSLSKVVAAKYFAMVTVLALPLAVLAVVPVILGMYGTVSYATAYCALLSLFLLGCALIAIGMFISSLTESQVIAAVMSIGVFLLLYFMSGIKELVPDTAVASFALFVVLAFVLACLIYYLTKNFAVSAIVGAVLIAGLIALYIVKGSLFEGTFDKMLSALCVFDKTQPFYNGILDVGAVIYYVTVSFLFSFFTVQSMEKKRWSEVD